MTTPEPSEREREIAREATGCTYTGYCERCDEIAHAFARYRAEVVAVEREACAVIVESKAVAPLGESECAVLYGAADAIRARG